MRHGKKFNHLSRKAPHRKAMLSNMAASLILHKRITTTVAKAKALRKYVEPLITKAKNDTTQSRRVVFSYLQDKESVKELFGDVAARVASRPGGYTRIIKTDYRLGDNADMCIMELVDFNEMLLEEAKPAKTKTRRSRRGSGKGKDAEGQASSAKAEESASAESTVEDATVVEEAEVQEEVAEEPQAEAANEETADSKDNTEDATEDQGGESEEDKEKK